MLFVLISASSPDQLGAVSVKKSAVAPFNARAMYNRGVVRGLGGMVSGSLAVPSINSILRNTNNNLTSITTANTDINMHLNNVFGPGATINNVSMGNINTQVSPSVTGSGPVVQN